MSTPDDVQQAEAPVLLSTGQPVSRRLVRFRRNALFVLIILLGVIVVTILSNGGTSLPGQTNPTQSPISSPSTVVNSPATTTSAISAIGNFREYPLPQPDAQLMRPAIDHEGRIWFGEMGLNALGVFDPQARTFQQIKVPQGRSGIMAVQVASDDTIWFVEQYANYIGHYFPKTGQFHIYPLPWLTIPDPGNAGKTLSLPGAPNELALDTHGNVWYTEFNADAVGRLNIHTGLIQHYPLSTKKSVQTLYPYGLTIDAQGMLWFTEASNDHIGRFNPATGKLQFFYYAGAKCPSDGDC